MPISPTPAFFNRARLIAKSVREWYPDAEVKVTVGEDKPFSIDRLMSASSAVGLGVTTQLVSEQDFAPWRDTQCPYLATVMNSYKPPFHGDHILMLDADVLPVKRFDELFVFDGISGMQTHVPPFVPTDNWYHLFDGFGCKRPLHWHEHTGCGVMCPKKIFSPPYFNSGMIFGPRWCFEKISEPYFAAVQYLRKVMRDTYWFDQIGLALAIAKAEIPVNVLPMRWNFANQLSFDEAFPDELADVRFIHAMRTDIVDRDKDFESEEALHRLSYRRDLLGSNEVLRARVAELTRI